MKDQKKPHNSIWLEIEKCDNPEKNHQRAEKFTEFLAYNEIFNNSGDRVVFNETTNHYQLHHRATGEVVELINDGHYFNLDYLADPKGYMLKLERQKQASN